MQSLYGILGKDAMKKYLYRSICLFSMLLLCLGACGGGIRIEREEAVSFASDESMDFQSAAPSSEGREESMEVFASAEASSVEEKIFVHVCGSVQQPGVYALVRGARAIEAVESAGGFTQDAAGDAVNLARRLEDGEKLYIPNREEGLLIREREALAPEGGTNDAASGEAGRVNLNTASKEELMSLPGIGEAKAEAILEYRKRSGGFESIEEIMQISGIKSAAFEKLKDRIEVR